MSRHHDNLQSFIISQAAQEIIRRALRTEMRSIEAATAAARLAGCEEAAAALIRRGIAVGDVLDEMGEVRS